MNLYKIINDWFTNEYEPFYGNWIYFNATPYIVGTVSMNAVAGDRVIKSYITGAKLKNIILAMDFVMTYDATGTSDINIDIMKELENFNSWVEEKNKLKQFPDFGINNTINKIEVLTNVPSMLVDTTQGLAKYQIQIKFEYLDESEVN